MHGTPSPRKARMTMPCERGNDPKIMNEPNGGSERQAPTKAVPWKWIGLGILVIAMLIAVRVLPVTHWLTEFNQWLVHLALWGILPSIGRSLLATVLFFPPLVL